MKLNIPEALRIEFETIEAVLGSSAKTRGVDALLLSWVKYEKQLRRLFSFLVYQHPNFNEENLDAIIDAFVRSRNLYPESFVKGIDELSGTSIPKLIGQQYEPLYSEITRIKAYRNKIMHGQVTGQSIESSQLEQDVLHIINWVESLANAAETAFGYNGLKRNTYRSAKSSASIVVEQFPFSNAIELKGWLGNL